jgi:hypothetical protein
VIIRIAAAVAGLLAVSGCKQVAPDANQPAVIVNPTEASREALQQAVNEELGTDVLLADDALTDTSILIIERRMPRAMTGSLAQGRSMDTPVRFTLMTNGTDCVLVEDRGGSRYLLANTRCEPR